MINHMPLKRFMLLLCIMIPLSSVGQLAPLSDQYMLNPVTINPAYAGNRGVFNISAFYRQQWVGITGAPETATLAGDVALLNSKVGLGFIVSNDRIGVTKKTSANSNYSFRINFGGGILSFGLGAGLITTNTAWSELVIVDPGDDNLLVDSKVFVVPDFSFGLYYTNLKYFAGLSIPRLLLYNFSPEKNKYILKSDPGQYYYLLNTGGVYDVAPKTKFLPSTLLSFSPGEKLLYDINAHFSFSDRLWLGTSYGNNRSVKGFVQFQANDQLRVAYTYNYGYGKLRTFIDGSHEIMFRYEFRYKADAINPLIF